MRNSFEKSENRSCRKKVGAGGESGPGEARPQRAVRPAWARKGRGISPVFWLCRPLSARRRRRELVPIRARPKPGPITRGVLLGDVNFPLSRAEIHPRPMLNFRHLQKGGFRLGSAYTPGLTVSADQIVHKVRRLPLKGEVLVRVGDSVEPTTVVARTELPGVLQAIKVADKLGVEAKDVTSLLKISLGDKVQVGTEIAESKGLFGMFKSTVVSEYVGTAETLSEATGTLLIREAPIPIEISAYMRGKVIDVIPDEGAIIETRGAMVQGIFGVGGERLGIIRVAVSGPDQILDANAVKEDDRGKILIGGSGVTLAAVQKAEQAGVLGLIAGAVKDVDLTKYLGYDIGVAITGQEAIPLTIIATEGFGILTMATRTFELFKSLEGKQASINGATQIRAGVIRPEVVVPSDSPPAAKPLEAAGGALNSGTPIRVIREPYFGCIGKVTDLPPELQKVESGTEVRVLKAKLEDGREVTVPRANVEIIAG